MTEFKEVSVKVGDYIRFIRPDPDSGVSCILAGYDTSYEVTRVEGFRIYIKTDKIPLMIPETLLIQGPGFDWIRVVDEKPWCPLADAPFLHDETQFSQG